MDENKKFYFSQVPQEEKVSFLNRAATDGLDVEVWQKGQDKDKVESFKINAFNEADLIFDLTHNAGLLSKLAGSRNKDKDVLLKLSFQSVYLFSSSHLTFDAGTEKYFLKIDQPVYKSQRRSNYRLHANSYIPIQIKIDDDVFDCNDISAGGISFNCEESFKEKFAKETFFSDVTIRLVSNRFQIPSIKVAATWPNKDSEEKKLGIGIAFDNMPEDVEEDLVLAINSEARGEELRKQALAKKASS